MGGLASNSINSANLNLCTKRFSGMNQGVGGRVLMEKTAHKKSHDSVPLSRFLCYSRRPEERMCILSLKCIRRKNY
jgi:hypothetical protein